MRVLVVEDEPDLLRILSQFLGEAGYAVDEASDGTEALHKGLGIDYDAIVLDLMLPGIDGLSVLRELRHSKTTPVLILTARDAVIDRVGGLDSGADDYLTKPFALAELVARLRTIIRRAAGHAHPLIQIGDVAVDTRARAVSVGGAPVTLTAREYSLVEFLAVRRGELVTRTMLYEHLFGDGEDSMSNLLDVHVANVRRKLGHDFITTRRGQGYLIDAANV